MTVRRGAEIPLVKGRTSRWKHVLPTFVACMLGAASLGAADRATAQDGWAQSCSIFQTWRELPGDRDDVGIWQSGLRAALATTDAGFAESVFLSDGTMGPQTGAALERLCVATPLVAGTNVLTGTLDLARHYAELSGTLGTGWPQLVALGLSEDDTSSSLGPVALRVAGGPSMTQAILQPGEVSTGAVCAAFAPGNPAPAIPDLDGLRVALQQLEYLNADEGGTAEASGLIEALSSACRRLPVVGDADDFIAALSRLGRIELSRLGALEELSSPTFVSWLNVAPETRLRRLLGTPEAVPSLLAEFAAFVPTGDGEKKKSHKARPLPEACKKVESPSITYHHLTAEDLGSLNGENEALAALLPLLEQSFDDAKSRLDTVLTVLDPLLTACTRAQISDILSPTGAADLGRLYEVNPEAPTTGEFQLLSEPLRTAIEGKIGVQDPSEPLLVDLIVEDLKANVSETLDAEISEIAAQVVGVAEPVDPFLDTPADDVPAFDPFDGPVPLEVDEDKLADIAGAIDDVGFSAALASADLEPAATPEILKASVAAALGSERNLRVLNALDQAPKAIKDQLHPIWLVTQEIIDEVAALPTLAPLVANFDGELPELVDISYPTQRLFERALANYNEIPRTEGQSALDSVTMAALVEVSRKTVDDATVARVPLDLGEGCGCTSTHLEHGVVYGLWPFWNAPVQGTDEEELPASAGLNLEVLDRVAFWGIQALPDGSVWPDEQWQPETAARFIASAHRHQVDADLSIELLGWQDWSPDQMEDVVDRIDDMTEQVSSEVFETSNWRSWLDTMPAAWDSRQVDGLTLFVNGYRPDMQAEDLANLFTVVKMLKSKLDERGQTINLAVDVPLSQSELSTDASALLFSNLAEFFPNKNRSKNTIDYLLVFLERGTSDTKKYMHSTIIAEPGFSGDRRENLLRSIVPIVPSGANEVIFHSADAGKEVRQTYGQLIDDLVYFRGSFAGIAFWQALQKGEEGEDGVPSSATEVTRHVSEQFDAPEFWLVPDTYNTTLNEVCRVICPNRFYIKFVAAITISFTLLLIAGATFNGVVRNMAYTYRGVRYSFLLTLVLLASLATCVARPFRGIGTSYWSIVFVCFLVIGFLYLYAKHRSRGKDGPKP